MDLNDQFKLEHLLFKERVCKTCGKRKSLLDDFYLTRKDRGTLASAYAYECKLCTIKRIVDKRKLGKNYTDDIYPDW